MVEHPADAVVVFIDFLEAEFAVQLTPVIFAPGEHFVGIGATFVAPGQKMVEGLAEMRFPSQHFHGDACQFLTGLVHGCRIFGQHIFFIRRDFLPVFVYFDSTDFDDFALADAAGFLLVPSDRVHFEIDKYGFHDKKVSPF